MDDVRAWGSRRSIARSKGCPCKTAVPHLLLATGSRQTPTGRRRLGSEWRQHEQTFPALAASRIDQVSVECANSRVPVVASGSLKGKDVPRGALSIVATDKVGDSRGGGRDDPARPAVRAARERLYPCTNCGMVPPTARSRAASCALVEGPRWSAVSSALPDRAGGEARMPRSSVLFSCGAE